MAALESPLPPTKLILMGPQGVSAMNGPRSEMNLSDEDAVASLGFDDSTGMIDGTVSEVSPDGSIVAVGGRSEAIRLVALRERVEPLCPLIEQVGTVRKIAFSSQANFIATWQKYDKEDPVGNLRVFSVTSGELVAHFPMKKLSSMLWPAIQWNHDESIAMRMVSNELHVFDGQDIAKGVIGKIQSQNLASFAMCPAKSDPVKVSIFTPEVKGRPASVKIVAYPHSSHPISSKTFFNAQDCDMDWSPTGSALLVKTSTDVDRTGTSYYGSTGLHLLHGSKQFEASVPMPKEGPVSDAKWAPHGRNFVVVAGTMPAVSMLFDMKANELFNFGSAHRNTISWSPHGRFLCLAGFGNLAGEMDFWDMNQRKKIGSNRAHCAVGFGWSPDSRFFMTCTTAPRMNVDNGFKLFRYNGFGPIYTHEAEQLYKAEWMPSSREVYPDRPQSPARMAGKRAEPEETKPAVYRPPRSTGAMEALIQAEREQRSGGGLKSATYQPPGSARRIPGMAPAAEKPKKTKAKKEKPKIVIPSDPAEREKRLKKLNKIMKAIQGIKEKKADGQEINADQKAKLQSEETVQEEIDLIKAAS